MSSRASQMLNAPTCYTTLTPNDFLPEPNICNQCKPWKLIVLNLLLTIFTQLVDARKSCFAPNTPDPLCAKDRRHLIRFPGMAAFKALLTLDIS